MLVDIAAQEESEREKVLAAIPEMYRDLMGQRWDEERMKNLRTRQAIHISKGIIERDIEKRIPEQDTPIVVYCSGGFRCALVADSLQRMGYTEVYSLENGLKGWADAGYVLEVK
jgi:rhodanese-related sulfurtransferase